MNLAPPLNAPFDALVAWAMTPERQDDVVAARAEYSQLAGDVFDEDRQLELRLTGFVEHYLCDRPAPWANGVTPAEARYRQALQTEGPVEAQLFQAFTHSWHGLFQVIDLAEGRVTLRSLSSRAEVRVNERRTLHGLSVKDVLEARLLPVSDGHVFSGAWVWHPHEAASSIVAEAERRRVAGLPERELLFDCARRSLKADRYRQIAIERIYDFSQK